MLGEILVVAALVSLVALAIRSIWKDHKKGGCCGDCSKCRGCK